MNMAFGIVYFAICAMVAIIVVGILQGVARLSRKMVFDKVAERRYTKAEADAAEWLGRWGA